MDCAVTEVTEHSSPVYTVSHGIINDLEVKGTGAEITIMHVIKWDDNTHSKISFQEGHVRVWNYNKSTYLTKKKTKVGGMRIKVTSNKHQKQVLHFGKVDDQINEHSCHDKGVPSIF